MPRNTDLSSHALIRHSPLKHTTSQVTGPISFLNPTTARLHDEPSQNTSEAPHAAYAWSSRNNRKGRHELVLSPSLDASPTPTPPATTSPKHILKTMAAMLLYYPYWDVSWWVAYIFTWGSVLWVFNAFFVFLPYIRPADTFSTEILYGGGITAFIGATVFEIGSVLLMIEAVNENRTDCFGWEIKQAIEGGGGRHGDVEKNGSEGLVIREKECTHHHANKKNFVGKGKKAASAGVKASNQSGSSEETATAGDEAMSKEQRDTEEKRREWIWWPNAKELRGHYLHELGFIACCSQMAGATIFWIAGFTALPGIQNKMSPGLIDGIYWTPQVIGGLGFVLSGTLFMLETQKRWYLPALNVLGWHIGAWNLIGGLGFTLSPIFGFYAGWGQYQAGCATFWGSWAFLIGSLIQLYESLDKRPVTVATLQH